MKLSTFTTNSELNKINNIRLCPIIDSVELINISDKEYFGQKYKDYISNSRLGLLNPLQNGSPESFFAGFGNNIITSDSLVMGSCVHGLILQPEAYKLCTTVDRANSKLGYVMDLCYEQSKNGEMVSEEIISDCASKCQYYDGVVSKFKRFLPDIEKYIKGRYEFEQTLEKDVEPLYLSFSKQEVLNECLNSLILNSQIQNLLRPVGFDKEPLPTLNENTIICNVRAIFEDGSEEILKLKSKLDNFTLDETVGYAVINDVKTTSRYCSTFKEGFDSFFYRREFGMYSTMLSLYLTKQGFSSYRISGNCLVVETSTIGHESCVFPVPCNEIMKGAREMKFLLKMAAYYKKYGY